jgi:N-acetylglucosaminyl-diphospho-decaprenol L-rhamnosyltransferase
MIGAVIVDYNAGTALRDAARSLLDDGIGELVVVENGAAGSSARALGELAGRCTIVAPGENCGFGAGVNRGVAALSSASELVIVANPDTVVHAGATAAIIEVFAVHPEQGILGCTLLTTTGEVYPSVRRFPNPLDAAGHALLSQFAPKNRFSARYRSAGIRPEGGVDWVSGAFFGIRRRTFEDLGGFDESYFMFCEDMDLCWRAHEAGWAVGVAPTAVVTHAEGGTRGSQPYRMVLAHHRSALRFASTTMRGPSRLLLPLASLVLGLRLVVSLVRVGVRRT